MLAGCKPWWCSILDIIDHHLKEILSFILSLIGFWGGKSIARREKDENGQLEPWQTRQVIALGVFLLFLLGLGVGIWKFTPGPVAASNGPGPAWDTGKLEQQINQLKTAIDHFQFTAPQPPAPAGFPAEITVSILTAAGALSLFFIRKILEDRSINIAIRAEITRLYEVICRHQEWRERCKEEKEKQRAAAAASGTEPEPSPDKPEPLIPFAYPVYTKHVENIGVLRRKIVAQAVTFYGWVDYLNRFQEIRKDYISNGTLAVFDQRYDGMLKKFKGTFKAAFGQDYEPFKPNKNNPPEI
jgi:hypothetical protein